MALFICDNAWCSIKDGYRTLAELEGASVVNLYADIDEKDDEIIDKMLDDALIETKEIW